MKLTMISHASMVVQEGAISLLCDPWFEGDVFNDSWSLLGKPAVDSPALDGVTHIWISHEHPDHLSFATLKRISSERRSRITLLYQKHISTRVYDVLCQLGFREVVELPLGRWTDLAGNFSVCCYSIGSIDSLLAVRANGATILNVNDCIVTPRIVRRLASQLGSIDVLLVQFSIAGWVGNPEDTDVATRKNVLDRMELCIRTFKPGITIPFASFVYFSHVENRYMNAWVNTPDQVCQRLVGSPTHLQFLYNGDSWSSRDGFQLAGDPLDRYRADFNGINDLHFRSHPSYTMEQLLDLGQPLASKVRTSLSRFVVRWVPPIYFYVLDLGCAVRFDLRKGSAESCQRLKSECDLALSSQALWYSFKFPWGFSTLQVSGRYKVTNSKSRQRALSLCHLLSAEILSDRLWRSMLTSRFWAFWWHKRIELFDRAIGKMAALSRTALPLRLGLARGNRSGN